MMSNAKNMQISIPQKKEYANFSIKMENIQISIIKERHMQISNFIKNNMRISVGSPNNMQMFFILQMIYQFRQFSRIFLNIPPNASNRRHGSFADLRRVFTRRLADHRAISHAHRTPTTVDVNGRVDTQHRPQLSDFV